MSCDSGFEWTFYRCPEQDDSGIEWTVHVAGQAHGEQAAAHTQMVEHAVHVAGQAHGEQAAAHTQMVEHAHMARHAEARVTEARGTGCAVVVMARASATLANSANDTKQCLTLVACPVAHIPTE